MERVTADRVEKAFAASGLEPARCDFYEINFGGANMACGLTAVAIAEKGSRGSDLWAPSRKGITPAIDGLGLTRNYVEGFIRGWDRPAAKPGPGELDWHLTPEYLAGFDDGVAAGERMGLDAKEAA